MAAKDLYHNAVVNALTRDNWDITADPLTVDVGDNTGLEIDLGAEKLIGAEKSGRKIAVEIKSFLSASPMYEFHSALGQFLDYREALAENEPDRVLYLAIPFEIYRTLFLRRFVQKMVGLYHVRLIVYRPQAEVIVEWLD